MSDPSFDIVSEINLHTPALLPTDYCPDVHERLTLYKRLSSCGTEDDLLALREELVDRFGDLPEAAKALLECHRLRIAARPLGVARVDATHETLLLQFEKHPPIEPARIIAWVQKKKARMNGPDKVRLEAKMPEWADRGRKVAEVFRELAA